jgi:hypothetical protein
MYDNKIRLSQDVIQKAELIAAEWGLKNARAAIEAVFRRYSDDYLYGRGQSENHPVPSSSLPFANGRSVLQPVMSRTGCEALDELEDLLAS